MRGIHKWGLLPCLCCLSISIGNLAVGETEAAFSSHVNAEKVEISTAFVFPAAIEQLEKQAEESAEQMYKQYQTILSTSSGESLHELNDRLNEISISIQELNRQRDNLLSIYGETLKYRNQVQLQESNSYEYVLDGFQKVENVLRDIKAAIDFSKIAALRAGIELKIHELEVYEEQVIEDDKENSD